MTFVFDNYILANHAFEYLLHHKRDAKIDSMGVPMCAGKTNRIYEIEVKSKLSDDEEEYLLYLVKKDAIGQVWDNNVHIY